MRGFQKIIIVMLLLNYCLVFQCHAQIRRDSDVGRAVSSLEKDRHLGIEYSRTTRFKLSSRKKTYRMGELISLDCSMLNSSTSKIFFHNLSGPGLTVSAFDEKGGIVGVLPYEVAMEAVVPESYSLVNPGSIIIGSYQLLAGCNTEGLGLFDDARREFYLKLRQGEVSYHKGMFERDLFVNWGDACLQITRPGTYKIIVEMGNDHVVISSGKPNPKTAVGIITSNTFELTITE